MPGTKLSPLKNPCASAEPTREDIINFDPLFSVTQKVYQPINHSWFKDLTLIRSNLGTKMWWSTRSKAFLKSNRGVLIDDPVAGNQWWSIEISPKVVNKPGIKPNWQRLINHKALRNFIPCGSKGKTLSGNKQAGEFFEVTKEFSDLQCLMNTLITPVKIMIIIYLQLKDDCSQD